MMDDWNVGGWGWGGMTLFIVVLTLVIALLFTRMSRETTGVPKSSVDEAERLLRQRFAAGEIDEEEFLRRQEVLNSRARS